MEIEKTILDSFDIDEQLLSVTINEQEKFNALRHLLIRRVEELAEKDMPKLLWILYRVDVSEKKLNDTLAQTSPDKFAATIADLVIERQIQKAETKKQFGENENDWNFDI